MQFWLSILEALQHMAAFNARQRELIAEALRHAWWSGFFWGLIAGLAVSVAAMLAWYVTKDEDVRREFWRFGKSKHLGTPGRG